MYNGLNIYYLISGLQQSKADLAVPMMSWSTNWPHCITMWVLVWLSVRLLGGRLSIATLRTEHLVEVPTPGLSTL